MHVLSVHMLPMPHFGQRFSPSVETEYWLSDSASPDFRCRRMINSVARRPTTARPMSAKMTGSSTSETSATEAGPPIGSPRGG